MPQPLLWLCAHNSKHDQTKLNPIQPFGRPHTWPDHLSDQIGLMVTVEQGHCTLAAVKRYWDTPCVGGRHNFFERPMVTKNNKLLPTHPALNQSRRSATVRIPRPITQKPEIFLQIPRSFAVWHLPGRGVSLIKKGLRLVWSRVIAL